MTVSTGPLSTGPFWATGELTGEAILLGTPAELIDAVVAHVDPAGVPAGASRYELRLCLAVVLAQELQSRLTQEAIRLGDLDLVDAPDALVDRILAPKEPMGLHTKPWTTTVVPLVLVAGNTRFQMPRGQVFVYPTTSDAALLGAIGRSGMISAGRLDSAGPARG